MLDKYNKTVKHSGGSKEVEAAYERLALWLLEFGKQEGTIKGQDAQEVLEHGKSA